MSHTRCFASIKTSRTGYPHSAQVVGHLIRADDGRIYMEDCDGNKIPLAQVLDKFVDNMVCINFNNLDYALNRSGNPTYYTTVYENNCP